MWWLRVVSLCLIVNAFTSLTKFPLKDCRSGNFDLLLHVGSVDAHQKTRLKAIVNLFSPNDHSKNLRLTLFLAGHDNGFKTLINFQDYNSFTDLISVMDGLKTEDVRNIQFVDSILNNSMQYFQLQGDINRNKTHVIIILCEYCLFKTNTDLSWSHINLEHNLEKVHTFIIQVSEFQDMTKEIEKYGVFMMMSLDDHLVDNQYLSMTLCGQCNTGWVMYKSQTNPDQQSCYKFEVSETLVSYEVASTMCSSLSSRLIKLETQEEYDFIKKTLSYFKRRNLKKIDQDSSFFYFARYQSDEVEKHKFVQWKNNRPFNFNKFLPDITLVTSISAIEFVRNGSLLNEGNIYKVSNSINQAKLVVCEFDLPLSMNQESDLQNYAHIDLTVRHSESLNKIKEENIRLFSCGGGSEAVPYSFMCDGRYDCQNGRDEEMCYCKVNTNKDILCDSKMGFDCYNLEGHCDGVADCPDQSDEANCIDCMETTFSNGECLLSLWFENLEPESFESFQKLWSASDRSADLVCNEMECTFTHLQNAVMSICTNETSQQAQSELPESESMVSRVAPRCVHLKGRYSKKPFGCRDLSHLENCQHFDCMDGFFKCRNSYCIPLYMVNDGAMDCPQGDDENEDIYNEISRPDLFQCHNSYILLHPVHVCDGHPHCPRGDDEMNCFKKCPSGFTCKWGVTAVTDLERVDYSTLFKSVDPRTKVLDLSGVNLSQANVPKLIPLYHLYEIYLSNCSLTFGIMATFLSSLGHGKYHTNHLDISVNNFSLSRSVEHSKSIISHFLNLFFVNMSHTNMDPLSANKLFFDYYLRQKLWIDLSFSLIENFVIDIYDNGSPLRYLNVSYSKLKTLDTRNIDYTTIQILDLRHTNLALDSKLSKTLHKITITSAVYADSFIFCCAKFRGSGIPDYNCYAPVDPISSCANLIGDVVNRAVLWLVAVIGFMGNPVVIVLQFIYHKSNRKKGSTLVLYNLNLSDFIMSIYLTIIASVDIHYRENFELHVNQWRDSSLCRVAGVLATLSYFTSAIFHFLLTMDRCLLFFKFKLDEHVFISITSVVTCWLLGVALSVVPLFHPDWQIYSLNSMCVDPALHVTHDTAWRFAFSTYITFRLTTSMFTLTGLVLIFKFVLFPPRSGVDISPQEVTVTCYVCLTVISNLFCWLPLCVAGVMVARGHVVLPETYALLLIVLIPLSSAVNPIIYIIRTLYKLWTDFKNG